MVGATTALRSAVAGLLVVILSGFGANVWAQLELSTPAHTIAQTGDTITIPLNLSNPGAVAIEAFGVRLFFPTDLLTFVTTQNAGTLTDDWIQASGQENPAGQVNIGGFNLTAIAGSGVLLNVIFTVKDEVSGLDTLKLRNFVNDLAGASTSDGLIEVPGPEIIVPIGLARQLPDNTPSVTIQGVITTVDFRLSSSNSSEYYLQDTTGGIRMFVFGGKAALNRGDRVLVKDGLINTNSGRKNIEAQADSIAVIDTPGLPAPQVVTISEYLGNRGEIEGEHVRFNNTRIIGNFPAAGNNATLTISDATGVLAMFVDLDTDIDGSTQPSNPVDIIGVATSFNSTPQIQPSVRADFFSGTTLMATLSGEQEVPSVSTPATGGGIFFLNADQTELAFRLKVCNLGEAITSAHFHNAAAGTNGAVVRTLTADFTDTVAVGVWRSTDTEPLSTTLVAELLAGNIYVNIHSASLPNGEIRGQVLSGIAVQMAAQLQGEQEVPPVSTSASGFGFFSLNANADTLSYNVGVTGLSGSISAAHFHNADRGKNGPVVRAIAFDTTGTFATGVWRSTDSEPLTPELVVELLAGQIYVNVHTAAHQSGEVRGQVTPGGSTLVPIRLARLLEDNTPNVTIEGVITTVDFRLSSTNTSEYYLQDLSGGIRMFVFNGKAALSQGELVRVTGLIGTNAGRKNIEVDAAAIDSMATPGLPQPRVVTVGSYLSNRAEIEGQYVRIDNANISGNWPATGSNATVSINDGTGDLAMFIDLDTDIDGSPQPPNPTNVFGVVTSFNGTLQIQPSTLKDFRVGVAEREEALPKVFHLSQNYPNPFNPSTIIRYDLPKPVHVKLVIYNMLGEKVRTLVDANEAPGFRQTSWDGRNDLGLRVVSGVYFYRIEAGDFVATRKLMVMK